MQDRYERRGLHDFADRGLAGPDPGRLVTVAFGAAIALLLIAAPSAVLAADPLDGLLGPLTEAVVEPLAQVAEPVTIQVVEPVTTQVVEPVVTEVVKPVTTQVVEPLVQPVPEGIVEPVVDPLVEPVVDPIVGVVDPIVEALPDEPRTPSTVDEPGRIPASQPTTDPGPGVVPPTTTEELPVLPVATADSSPQDRGSTWVTDGPVITERPNAGPATELMPKRPLRTAARTASSMPASGPRLAPIGLPGGGSNPALGAFSAGLAVGLAMLLLFLMPPPFVVRRLNLAAVFWRPLCFVSPLERPG